MPGVSISMPRICNGDTTGIGFSDNEVPAGTIDGVNKVFTLANTPNPATSLRVYYNSGRQTGTYSLVGTQLTLNFTPQPGDLLVTDYRY